MDRTIGADLYNGWERADKKEAIRQISTSSGKNKSLRRDVEDGEERKEKSSVGWVSHNDTSILPVLDDGRLECSDNSLVKNILQALLC